MVGSRMLEFIMRFIETDLKGNLTSSEKHNRHYKEHKFHTLFYGASVYNIGV